MTSAILVTDGTGTLHDLFLKVAEQMTRLPLGPTAGLVPDMAGPRMYTMAGLLRGYLLARRRHRLMAPARLPGNAARAFRDGANLAPGPAVDTGRGKTS